MNAKSRRIRGISPIVAVAVLILISIALGIYLFMGARGVTSVTGDVLITGVGAGSPDGSKASLQINVHNKKNVPITISGITVTSNDPGVSVASINFPSGQTVPSGSSVSIVGNVTGTGLYSGTTLVVVVQYQDPTGQAQSAQTTVKLQ